MLNLVVRKEPLGFKWLITKFIKLRGVKIAPFVYYICRRSCLL